MTNKILSDGLAMLNLAQDLERAFGSGDTHAKELRATAAKIIDDYGDENEVCVCKPTEICACKPIANPNDQSAE
jgi:hypothetical protein